MWAIVVHRGGGPEVLDLEEVPDPQPGDGQVLVRVEAAAVNHFDLTQRSYPAQTGTSLPFTPGVDAAGTRTDTGERVLVSGVRGAYAELLAAPAEKVRPIPESLDAARAAALGVAYSTAWAALVDAGLQRGETLLVQAGSSGTGQAAIDIGRHLGATVHATASESKHGRLRELGANVVFDPVGGTAFERSLAALASGGRLVTPGALESPIVTLDLWRLIGKRLRIVGSGPASGTTDLDHLIELAGKGELSPVVDRELPLEQAAEAHRLIEERQVLGKIVLMP